MYTYVCTNPRRETKPQGLERGAQPAAALRRQVTLRLVGERVLVGVPQRAVVL